MDGALLPAGALLVFIGIGLLHEWWGERRLKRKALDAEAEANRLSCEAYDRGVVETQRAIINESRRRIGGAVPMTSEPNKIFIKIVPDTRPNDDGVWIEVEDPSPSVKLCFSWIETERVLTPVVPDGFHVVAVEGSTRPAVDVPPRDPYMNGARKIDLIET